MMEETESFNSDLDVEALRNSHESNTEWRLRSAFLRAHLHKFPLPRLMCLSCCFVNIEVIGSTYPKEVMDQIRELKETLPKDCREFKLKVQEEKMIKFVRSEDQLNQEPRQGSSTNPPHKDSQTGVRPAMSFVKAQCDFQSTDVAFQKPELRVSRPLYQAEENCSNVQLPYKDNFKESLQDFSSNLQNFEIKRGYADRFGKLVKHLRAIQSTDKNSISKLHLAADKLRITIDCVIGELPVVKNGVSYYISDLSLDSVLISSGEGTNKKLSKHDTYTKAIEKLMSPYFRVIELESGSLELETSDKPFGATHGRKRNQNIAFVKSESEDIESNHAALASSKKKSRSNLERGLSEFIIMEPSEPLPSSSSGVILRQSADFSKMLLEFEFRDVGSVIRCRVFLEGQFVEEDFGPTKTASKNAAATKALDKLRHLCWTILRKQNDADGECNVTREELMGDINKLNEAISSENIGNKMLQKMGWTGGGVGKEGNKGIAEPVSMTSVINREGLGLMSEKGIEAEFLPKVKKVLMDYARSADQNDLEFSPEFNKEERAIIHQECRKLGLKSHSRGSKNGRFLAVSRKRSATQLLSHVMHSGGSTKKYDLLPPGTNREQLDESV